MNCCDCGETILACNSREHAGSHLRYNILKIKLYKLHANEVLIREHSAFRPETHTRIRCEKYSELDEMKDSDGRKDLEDI